jgi:hypothetical protein
LVDFYDGRLIPQPTEGDTYTKRTNSLVRMLVCDVKDNKVHIWNISLQMVELS